MASISNTRAALAAAGILLFAGAASGQGCPSDVNKSGYVNIDDVVDVILAFGECPQLACEGDVNGDLTVNIDDVVIVVLNFGPCP